MFDWPSLTGTVAGWVTAGGVTTIAAILAYVYIWRGRIAVDAKRVANENEADIRDHYADEVRQLRQQLERQSTRHGRVLRVAEGRARQAALDAEARHEQCVRDRDELRDKVWALKDQVSGLVRLLLQNSAAGTLILSADQVSNAVREAAERVDRLFAPKEEKPDADPS